MGTRQNSVFGHFSIEHSILKLKKRYYYWIWTTSKIKGIVANIDNFSLLTSSSSYKVILICYFCFTTESWYLFLSYSSSFLAHPENKELSPRFYKKYVVTREQKKKHYFSLYIYHEHDHYRHWLDWAVSTVLMTLTSCD